MTNYEELLKNYIEDVICNEGTSFIKDTDNPDLVRLRDVVIKDLEDYRLKIEMKRLNKMMEKMANAPKERIGERTPGEVGSYERQSRITGTSEALPGIETIN